MTDDPQTHNIPITSSLRHFDFPSCVPSFGWQIVLVLTVWCTQGDNPEGGCPAAAELVTWAIESEFSTTVCWLLQKLYYN